MLSKYSFFRRRRLNQYFRCLSANCFDGIMADYFNFYEFTWLNRWLRKGEITLSLKKNEVANAEQLKDRIRTLLDADADLYREYRRIHRILFVLPEAARSKYIEARQGGGDHAKLVLVNHCLHQLPSGNISGYGAAWAVALSRIGRAKGWLTAEEAWQYKLAAARFAQSCYDSWGEFFIAHSIGALFSQPNPKLKETLLVTGMVSLMEGSSLLYRKAKWDMNLEPD